MRNQNMTPYISVVFTNRNDGYPSRQVERMQRFIDYYAYYSSKYSGLFEFIICDWNPPKDKVLLQHAYNWSVLGSVKHVVVSPETHARLCPEQNRPILDYIGRNVCVRHATAPYILVINQDIYLSASIFAFLAKRELSRKHFYRADRCDFEYDFAKDFDSWDLFEEYAAKQSIVKHIRPWISSDEMSLKIDGDLFYDVYTKAQPFEWIRDGVIYSDCMTFLQKTLRWIYKIFSPERIKQMSYKKFSLHTNASGDFLVIPKAAFERVRGFVETSAFYMHLDSYMCIQLFSAGYRQAILAYPHTVFHSDHPRGALRSESMTYTEHTKVFEEMCLGISSYAFNDSSWGLYHAK